MKEPWIIRRHQTIVCRWICDDLCSHLMFFHLWKINAVLSLSVFLPHDVTCFMAWRHDICHDRVNAHKSPNPKVQNITFFNLTHLDLDLQTHLRYCRGTSLYQFLHQMPQTWERWQTHWQGRFYTFDCWCGREKRPGALDVTNIIANNNLHFPLWIYWAIP